MLVVIAGLESIEFMSDLIKSYLVNLAILFLGGFMTVTYIAAEDNRLLWDGHHKIGFILDVISNSVMWLIGVLIVKWEDTTFGSVLFFGGLSLYVFFQLILTRPPTDFGLFAFLISLTLGQVMRHYGVNSHTVFIYWGVFSVLFILLKLLNPHKRPPPVIPM